jgi:2,4-dienoyl-CoA reductase-like NADH-dependent reductase (Old Yellow Enzyme family)
VGASPVKLDAPGDFQRDLIRELTIAEIEEIVDKWASAAVRAQKAGFDGVDINPGSTHLVHNLTVGAKHRAIGKPSGEGP